MATTVENLFSGPVAGQSLTNDPDTRLPCERPTKFTTVNQALDHLFAVIRSPEFIRNFDELVSADKRFSVDTMALAMLEDGFNNGLWTVDMKFALIEPLMVLMTYSANNLKCLATYSSDTGYENRSGWEEVGEEIIDVLEEMPEESSVEPTGTSQVSPLVPEAIEEDAGGVPATSPLA